MWLSFFLLPPSKCYFCRENAYDSATQRNLKKKSISLLIYDFTISEIQTLNQYCEQKNFSTFFFLFHLVLVTVGWKQSKIVRLAYRHTSITLRTYKMYLPNKNISADWYAANRPSQACASKCERHYLGHYSRVNKFSWFQLSHSSIDLYTRCHFEYLPLFLQFLSCNRTPAVLNILKPTIHTKSTRRFPRCNEKQKQSFVIAIAKAVIRSDIQFCLFRLNFLWGAEGNRNGCKHDRWTQPSHSAHYLTWSWSLRLR